MTISIGGLYLLIGVLVAAHVVCRRYDEIAGPPMDVLHSLMAIIVLWPLALRIQFGHSEEGEDAS